MDFLTLGAGDDGDLRTIHQRAMFTQWSPDPIRRNGVEKIMVASGLRAPFFLKGLGLVPRVGDRRDQPVLIQTLLFVVGKGHTGARKKIRAITLTPGGAGIIAQCIPAGRSE